MRRAATIAILFCLGVAAADEDRDARRRALQDEIDRMERELAALDRRQGGVLDDLERLSAELSLGRARLDEIRLQRENVAERVAGHEATLEALGEAQAQRERYLAFRLREIYKDGAARGLSRMLGVEDADGYWEGLQYAAFLSERDAAVLEGYREDAKRLEQERAKLVEEIAAEKGIRATELIRRMTYDWLERELPASQYKQALAEDQAVWAQAVRNRVEGRAKSKRESEERAA